MHVPLLGRSLLLPLAAALLTAQVPADTSAGALVSPGDVVAGAPDSAWTRIAAEDMLVMDLAPLADKPRRVVIQLLPAPIAAPWVGNVRKLAAAHWWDGASVYRVQDNYVAQWGDVTERKPLPAGLSQTSPSGYETSWASLPGALTSTRLDPAIGVEAERNGRTVSLPNDLYAAGIVWYSGFPLGVNEKAAADGRTVWPLHCYAMVGVARDLAPNAGSGAELYAVIGHAPRHLDRNIAMAGRVIEGIEHLSSLPRGTGKLGFYEAEDERVPITRVRLASDLPPAERPRFAYLTTEGETWSRYENARRNREPPFFTVPAGNADVCNIPVPVKRLP